MQCHILSSLYPTATNLRSARAPCPLYCFCWPISRPPLLLAWCVFEKELSAAILSSEHHERFFPPTLVSAGFLGGPRVPGPGLPTMSMCLAICASCACYLDIFTEEKTVVENYLILWRNNYYTYWFPESRSNIWI